MESHQNGQQVLSLCVTEEQRLAIQAFFNHNDWDFREVTQHSNSQSLDEENSPENDIISSHDHDNVEPENENQSGSQPDTVEQLQNGDTCPECFCSPCVTRNRQNWLGNGQIAHVRNSGIRKSKYKLFWRMLQNRGAWSIQQYLNKKARLLNRDRVDESVVVVRREVMPHCVLNLVRELYPNPKSKPYMGHKWY